MVIMDSSNSPLADRFFAPLTGIADRCPAARSCPELPDLSWLHLGITLKRKMGAMIRRLMVRGLAEGVAGSVAWLIFIR